MGRALGPAAAMKMRRIRRRLRRTVKGVMRRSARSGAAARARATSHTTTIGAADRDRIRRAKVRERRVTGFSLDWLRLRAPADRAARDLNLARRFAAALRR